MINRARLSRLEAEVAGCHRFPRGEVKVVSRAGKLFAFLETDYCHYLKEKIEEKKVISR